MTRTARLLIALLMAFSGAALASLEEETVLPKWELGGVFGYASLNEYVGSSYRKHYAVPVPYFVYRTETVTIDRNLLRTRFYRSENTEFGLSLGGSIPVSSRSNGPRDGMPELDPALELGLEWNHRFYYDREAHLIGIVQAPLRGVVSIGSDGGDYRGLLFNPSVRLLKNRYFDNGAHEFSASVGLVANSGRYSDYLYGVEAPYATEQRPAYRSKGGYAGLRLTAGYRLRVGNAWVGVFTRYWNIDGAVFENSPLVDTRHSLAAGIAIGWVYKKYRDEDLERLNRLRSGADDLSQPH